MPYLGLMVAEPLATPFAQPGNGQWSTNLINAVLSGTTNLSVTFTAHDGKHPLQQVDLFVDGVYYSTLTNLAPASGNQLTVTLNGYPLTYAVPTNSTASTTLNTIATGLASLINAATNATQVRAQAYGDRVQLQSVTANPAADPFYFADNTPTNTPGLAYNVSSLPASFPPQMKLGPPNKSGVFSMQVGIPAMLDNVVMASTNLINWQPILTNNVPGLLNFTDYDSTNYPARFYPHGLGLAKPDSHLIVTANRRRGRFPNARGRRARAALGHSNFHGPRPLDFRLHQSGRRNNQFCRYHHFEFTRTPVSRFPSRTSVTRFHST